MIRLAVVLCIVAACNWIPVNPSLPILPTHMPIAGRIVGGELTNIDDQPHQIALLYGGSLFCGGSIARADVVISAGHCVVTTTPTSYSIRAGSSFHASGGQVVSVSRVLRHEQYDDFDIDYDIALFFLSSSITLGSSANVIALPAADKPLPAGSLGVISGWGATSEGGSISSQLHKVEIPIVDQSTCVFAYNMVGWSITDRMVCAGVQGTNGKDACQGDSGGPLVIDNELVGITSFGYGCARNGYPGVWARVPALVTWVNNID